MNETVVEAADQSQVFQRRGPAVVAGDDVVHVAPVEVAVTTMELAVPVSVANGSALVRCDVGNR